MFQHPVVQGAIHNYFLSRCYKIHDNQATWFDARNTCLKQEGSDLAIFENGSPSNYPGSGVRGEYWIGPRNEIWAWLNDISKQMTKLYLLFNSRPSNEAQDLTVTQYGLRSN